MTAAESSRGRLSAAYWQRTIAAAVLTACARSSSCRRVSVRHARRAACFAREHDFAYQGLLLGRDVGAPRRPPAELSRRRPRSRSAA